MTAVQPVLKGQVSIRSAIQLGSCRPLLVDCCGVWLCLKIRGSPPFSSMVIIIFPMFFNSYDWGVYKNIY